MMGVYAHFRLQPVLGPAFMPCHYPHLLPNNYEFYGKYGTFVHVLAGASFAREGRTVANALFSGVSWPENVGNDKA